MTIDEKYRYIRLFQKVIQKGVESEINYSKIFKEAKALGFSVQNSYSEYQLMHTFLDKLQHGGK